MKLDIQFPDAFNVKTHTMGNFQKILPGSNSSTLTTSGGNQHGAMLDEAREFLSLFEPLMAIGWTAGKNKVSGQETQSDAENKMSELVSEYFEMMDTNSKRRVDNELSQEMEAELAAKLLEAGQTIKVPHSNKEELMTYEEFLTEKLQERSLEICGNSYKFEEQSEIGFLQTQLDEVAESPSAIDVVNFKNNRIKRKTQESDEIDAVPIGFTPAYNEAAEAAIFENAGSDLPLKSIDTAESPKLNAAPQIQPEHTFEPVITAESPKLDAELQIQPERTFEPVITAESPGEELQASTELAPMMVSATESPKLDAAPQIQPEHTFEPVITAESPGEEPQASAELAPMMVSATESPKLDAAPQIPATPAFEPGITAESPGEEPQASTELAPMMVSATESPKLDASPQIPAKPAFEPVITAESPLEEEPQASTELAPMMVSAAESPKLDASPQIPTEHTFELPEIEAGKEINNVNLFAKKSDSDNVNLETQTQIFSTLGSTFASRIATKSAEDSKENKTSTNPLSGILNSIKITNKSAPNHQNLNNVNNVEKKSASLEPATDLKSMTPSSNESMFINLKTGNLTYNHDSIGDNDENKQIPEIFADASGHKKIKPKYQTQSDATSSFKKDLVNNLAKTAAATRETVNATADPPANEHELSSISFAAHKFADNKSAVEEGNTVKSADAFESENSTEFSKVAVQSNTVSQSPAESLKTIPKDAKDASVNSVLTPTYQSEQISNNLLANLDGGVKEFTMRLKPDRLGEITVKLVEESGILTVSIVTQKSQTREVLSEQISNLGDTLRENGIVLGKVTVENQGQHFYGGFSNSHDHSHSGFMSRRNSESKWESRQNETKSNSTQGIPEEPATVSLKYKRYNTKLDYTA